MASAATRTGRAPIGPLEMYYEVHGSGRPLVLVHGADMTVEMMGPLLTGLARHRRVIVPEMQGTGERPMSIARSPTSRWPTTRPRCSIQWGRA